MGQLGRCILPGSVSGESESLLRAPEGNQASARIQDITCMKAPIHSEARYHRISEALLGGTGVFWNERHLGTPVLVEAQISISSTAEWELTVAV